MPSGGGTRMPSEGGCGHIYNLPTPCNDLLQLRKVRRFSEIDQ